MAYIYAIPIILVSVILYIVAKKWDLKLLKNFSKIILIFASIYFIITYASFLGYNIPFISDFCNNLTNYIV